MKENLSVLVAREFTVRVFSPAADPLQAPDSPVVLYPL